MYDLSITNIKYMLENGILSTSLNANGVGQIIKPGVPFAYRCI